MADLRTENKKVPIYNSPGVGDHCHVNILDKYIKKLPEEVKRQDFFYARPRTKLPKNPDEPWYAPVPAGRNILSPMLKDMCFEAGIHGHKTNHSLRATGASELFEAGVPEKIIKERTGHKSLDALRTYERTTSEQQKAVSNFLCANQKTTYSQAIQEQTLLFGQQSQPSFPIQQPFQVFKPFYNNCTFNFSSHESAAALLPVSAPSVTSIPIPTPTSAPMPCSSSSTESDLSSFFDSDIVASLSD